MYRPSKAQVPRVAGAHPTGAALLLLGALSYLALLGGCKSDGRLTVQLELPSETTLNPMEDSRLHSFSLTVTDADGTVRKINTVPFDPAGHRLDIGEVPVGHAGKVALVGYSATNQVLAYGEVGPLEIDATGELSVAMALRKPFTYLSGGPSVTVFDTSLSHAADMVPPIDIASPGQITTAVATTPDGRFVLAAVADPDPEAPTPAPSKLLIFNTAQHGLSFNVPLAYRPDYLSVSDDGHWAVLSTTAENWVTVVDVREVIAGADPAGATHSIVFAAPKRAAFVKDPSGGDLAVILRDQMAIGTTCTPEPQPSTLSVIELPEGTLLNSTPITAARDIASRPGDSRVFVAQPCLNRIAVFDTRSYTESSLISAKVPTSLIVSDDTLWIGSEDVSPNAGATAARITITAVNLNTLAQDDPIETPFLPEGYVLRIDDQASSALVLRANPLSVGVYHLSVPPGGTRISALVYATYYGDYRSDPITLTNPAIEQMEIASFRYVGLDTTSGEIRRRFRGLCFARINEVDDPLYYCDELEAHEAPAYADEFLPTGATSLFGVP